MAQTITLKELRDLKHGQWQPFILSLNQQSVKFETLHRLMPQKRLVAEARWQGQTVIAKLFFGSRAPQYFAAEQRGYHWLQNASVMVPSLLATGETIVAGAYLLLFEKLSPANDLQQIWHGESATKLQQLLTKIQKIVVSQHRHHGYYPDIHVGNFMETHSGFYVIDSGAIAIETQLSENQVLTNLARLYAQLPIPQLNLIEPAFHQYCQQRAWSWSEQRLKYLQIKEQQRRYQRIIKHQQRSLRCCSDAECQQDFFQFAIWQRGHYSPQLQQFSSHPEQYLRDYQTSILKNGRTCTVFELQTPVGHWVVKRYNIKSWWHCLKRSFRPSRARKSWRNAHALQLWGLPTAAALALIEKRWWRLHSKSYLLTEYIQGSLLSDYFTSDNSWHDKKVVAEACIQLIKQLARAGICHGDMKATNFKIVAQRPLLLDLDSMKIYPRHNHRFCRAFTKDLKRFMKNWQTMPEVSDLFATKIKRIEKDLVRYD